MSWFSNSRFSLPVRLISFVMVSIRNFLRMVDFDDWKFLFFSVSRDLDTRILPKTDRNFAPSQCSISYFSNITYFTSPGEVSINKFSLPGHFSEQLNLVICIRTLAGRKAWNVTHNHTLFLHSHFSKGLEFSIKVLIDSSLLAEVFSIEDSQILIIASEFWKFKKAILVWYIPLIKSLFLHNFWIDFFHQGIIWDLSICRIVFN